MRRMGGVLRRRLPWWLGASGRWLVGEENRKSWGPEDGLPEVGPDVDRAHDAALDSVFGAAKEGEALRLLSISGILAEKFCSDGFPIDGPDLGRAGPRGRRLAGGVQRLVETAFEDDQRLRPRLAAR